MKLKNFLKALCLTCAVVAPVLTMSSCTNDNADKETSGYTPIRPVEMQMSNGDILTLGTTGTPGLNKIWYDFSAIIASGNGISGTILTTYEDSSTNAVLKTLNMNYGVSQRTYDDGELIEMDCEETRVLTIEFTSANTGFVVSDSWTSITDDDDANDLENNITASQMRALSYASGTTIIFK